MQSAILLAATAIVSLAPRETSAADARALEPARSPTCVRYFALEGDVKPDALRKAVVGLSTPDADAKIAFGPETVSSKPKARFLALELPAGTSAKDAEKALRKAAPKAVELAWTAFQGPERELSPILGFSPLECVVGMDNDLRWFELDGGLARFYHLPGKLDEKAIRSRFASLYQPFSDPELGELVRARVEWALAAPLEPAAARAAEKALAKVPGVVRPRIDVAARKLVLEVAHAGLRAAAGGGIARESRVPGNGCVADDLLDALAAAGVALEASK